MNWQKPSNGGHQPRITGRLIPRITKLKCLRPPISGPKHPRVKLDLTWRAGETITLRKISSFPVVPSLTRMMSTATGKISRVPLRTRSGRLRRAANCHRQKYRKYLLRWNRHRWESRRRESHRREVRRGSLRTMPGKRKKIRRREKPRSLE